VLEELAVIGAQLVSFRLYTHGRDLLSQDQLLDTGTNLMWSASFYGTDGSTRYLTDAAGVVTDTYDYDAFGNLIAQTVLNRDTGMHEPLSPLNSHFATPDLNLYYLRARYHNPQTGRFWSMEEHGFLTEAVGAAAESGVALRWSSQSKNIAAGVTLARHFRITPRFLRRLDTGPQKLQRRSVCIRFRPAGIRTATPTDAPCCARSGISALSTPS
jgi:YD repeat-containing protein